MYICVLCPLIHIHVLDSKRGGDMTEKEPERELTRNQIQIHLLLQYAVPINNKL